MPVAFKNRGNFGEVLTGIFYYNFFFPMNVFWVVMAVVLLRVTHVTDYLRTGQYLWFAGAVGHLFLFQLFFVALALTGLYGLIYLVRYAKSGMKDEEFVFDEGSVSIKSEVNEIKLSLAKIPGYVESRGHFILVRHDMGVTVFGKKTLTQEQVQEIRVILRGKHRRFVEWMGKVFWPVSFLVLLVTLYALITPRYSVRSTSDNPQAFWQGDTAVFSIPVYTHGQKEVLFQVMHPLLYALLNRQKQPDYTQPVVENHVLVIRDGKLRSVTLRGNLEETVGTIQPIGNDLLMMRYAKRRQDFSKFDGENFIPVGEEERTELLRRMKECRRDRCGWKQFKLWDEDEEEKASEETDQQYRATIPLKSSTLVLGMDVTWVDRQEYAKDCIYTLKGLDPKGGTQELLAVGGKSRRVGAAEYDRIFPEKVPAAGAPGMEEPDAPSRRPPPPADIPATTDAASPPAEAVGNSGAAEKPVEPLGTSGAATAPVGAAGNSANAVMEAAGNSEPTLAVPTARPSPAGTGATPAATGTIPTPAVPAAEVKP